MKRFAIMACFALASIICAPIFTEHIAQAAPLEYIMPNTSADVLPVPTIVKTKNIFVGRSFDVTSYTLIDGATSNVTRYHLRC